MSNRKELPPQRKAGCSAARSKGGLLRPQGDARGVATACRSKGGCDKRFINKNNGNAAEQGGVATASRSKGGCDKGFMNKNNYNSAEQGGLRRGVAPPGGLLIDKPEQGGLRRRAGARVVAPKVL